MHCPKRARRLLFPFLLLGGAAGASAEEASAICAAELSGSGPLAVEHRFVALLESRCRAGDVLHIRLDRDTSAAPIVARLCSFDHQIHLDRGKETEIACVFPGTARQPRP